MRFFAAILLVFCQCFTVFGEVLINEVAYQNDGYIQDEDSDTPDWIELYNAGNNSVSLKGWGLTDNPENLNEWIFPNIEIHPGQYILVFASGKNRKSDYLHTSFKLGIMVEPVLLINTNMELVDEFQPVCVPANRSAARIPDGGLDWQVVQEPTPGASNNASEVLKLNYQRDSLILNYEGGYYTSDIKLEIKNSVPGNTIYYSVDGSELNEQSEVYGGGILLHDRSTDENNYCNISTCIDYRKPQGRVFKASAFRAISYSEGCPASEPVTETFFIHNEMKGRYPVPVVSIITDPDNLFSDEEGIYVLGNNNNAVRSGNAWERPVHLEIYDKYGSKLIDQNAGARIHGRGTRISAQKSLRLYSGDKYRTSGFNYPFFDDRNLSSYSRLTLRTSLGDFSNTLFTDRLCHELVRDLNVNYMSGITTVVFINGEYWGIQSIRERQDSAYIASHHSETKGPYDIIDYEKLRGPMVKQGSIDAYEELIDLLLNSGLSAEERYQRLTQAIDISNMIDYYIAEIYLGNVDFPDLNQRLFKDIDQGQWQWFFFDCDACFFRYNYDHLSDYFMQEDDAFARYADWSMVLLTEMLKHQEFRDRFFQRFYWAINTVFAPERVIAKIDSLKEAYQPLMPEHIARWHYPLSMGTWFSDIDQLKQVAVGRPVEVTEQLMKYYGSPFRVYPNPMSGNFYLKSDFFIDDDFQLNIYDISGRKVYTQNYTDGIAEREIRLSNTLSGGIYLLQVQSGYLISSQKIIVRHD